MRRLWIRGLLALLLLCLAAGASAERTFPDCMRFSQEMQTEPLGRNRLLLRTYPSTARPEVDAEIAALVDALAEAGKAFLPAQGGSRVATRLDSGATVTRVGDRWMSFLVIGRVSHEGKQLWVDFDTRVYDMETGNPVTLEQVIDAGKGGWEYLAGCVREQLTAHFPALEPDPALLDALCARDALAHARFTLSPGHLSLHYPAGALYPSHDPCLMRVDVYYPALQPYMTDAALAETDCTGYTLIALTYDDGPAAGPSDRLLDQLRLYGGQATFFVVGSRVDGDSGVVRREYDAGMSIQSHNWVHRYSGFSAADMAAWEAKTREALERVIGVPPAMMRCPGGNEEIYFYASCTLPMIHWSVTAEASPETDTPGTVNARVSRAADGDIVLLHDLKVNQYKYAAVYLPNLAARGVMLVTLPDLFVLRGLSPEAGTVVSSADKTHSLNPN